MNKDQAIERLTFVQKNIAALKKEDEELRKIIYLTDTISKEERLLQIIISLTLKTDPANYPRSVFLFSGDQCRAEFDLENRTLYLDYDSIWSVFETEYSLSDDQIHLFTRAMVESHFELKKVLPMTIKGITHGDRGRGFMSKVENHFRMR